MADEAVVVRGGDRALASQVSQAVSKVPGLVMRRPTVAESFAGFDFWFSQFAAGKSITLAQATTEAAIRSYTCRQESPRQQAMRQAALEREAREWHEARRAVGEWRVVEDEPLILEQGGRALLESGQVAYRAALYAAAIERRLQEIEAGCQEV